MIHKHLLDALILAAAGLFLAASADESRGRTARIAICARDAHGIKQGVWSWLNLVGRMNTRLSAILLLALPLTVSAAHGQLPPGSVMTVGSAHSHSVSLPLNKMTLCPGASLPAPSTVEAGVPPILLEFEGTGLADIIGGGCSLTDFASDDSAAVGPHRLVQVVNVALAVYDKAGTRLAGPVSTTTFWANQPDCGGNQVWSDAVVIYDRQADRWVISRPGGLPHGADLCLAVSQTSDPTGPYDQYAFAVNNTDNKLDGFFNDYAKISAWPGSYFATADPDKIFSGRGNTISAFDRAAMLAGESAPAYVTFFVPAPVPMTGVAHSHMLPAQLDGKKSPPDDAPGYIVQVQDANWGFPAGRLQVYEFQVDWTNPSSATLTPTTSLSPQSFDTNPCPWDNGNGQSCIHQPVGPSLDSLAYGYMMFRLSYRNFGDHQVILLNHTVAADGNPNHDHAGIRWYELRRTKKAPWSIYQQGTYVPDARDRWLGSIAMDRHGDIALGFDVSGAGAGQYASIHYASRQPSDPLGQLPREVSIIEGHGAQLGDIFFGDYSQMTVDPKDDCTFWYTNTYYPQTTTSNSWHTRIAAFRFAACHREDEDAHEHED